MNPENTSTAVVIAVINALVLMVLSALTGKPAFADGGMSTGGGEAVLCRNVLDESLIEWAQFYDLYEGQIRYAKKLGF